MKKEDEQEERHRSYLKEHERLTKLFWKDRLSFERERKRLIEENIAAESEKERRDTLILTQQRVDKYLRYASSEHNRFVTM